MPKFLIEYPFNGAMYGESIHAQNLAEANERLKAIPWGKISGELHATIEGPEGADIPKPDLVMRVLMGTMTAWMNWRYRPGNEARLNKRSR